MPVALPYLAVRLDGQPLSRRGYRDGTVTIGLPELDPRLEPALLNQWMRVPKAVQVAHLHDGMLRPELLHKMW